MSREANTVMQRPGHGGSVTRKSTAACSGGSRQTRRSRWWKEQRDKAVAWERSYRAERQELLQAGQMSLHSKQYCENLEEILCRIKFGGALAGDTIPKSYSPGRLAGAIETWWRRYFPANLQANIVVPSTGVWRPAVSATSHQQVRKLLQ